MIICPKCKAQNSDNSLFCSVCGANLSAAANAPGSSVKPANDAPRTGTGSKPEGVFLSQDVERHTEIKQYMKDLITYFLRKNSAYEEYDAVNAKLNRLSGPKVGLLIVGILFALFGFGGIVLNFVMGRPVFEFFFFLCVFFAALSVLMIVLFIVKANKYRKTYEALVNRFNELSAELWNHYNAYGECLVGYEFSNPVALISFYSVINQGRADKVTDAINIVFEEKIGHSNYAANSLRLQQARLKQNGSGIPAVYSAACF